MDTFYVAARTCRVRGRCSALSCSDGLCGHPKKEVGDLVEGAQRSTFNAQCSMLDV